MPDWMRALSEKECDQMAMTLAQLSELQDKLGLFTYRLSLPHQDDWDDTLYAARGKLREAMFMVDEGLNILREGS